MVYPISCCQAGFLSFAEEKKCIYAASSNVKELVYPNCTVTSKFSNSRHASLHLSEDERFLALYSSDHHLAIYDTAELSHPIFKKKWKNIATSPIGCYYFQHSGLLVPVQNVLYFIDWNAPDDNIMIYGEHLPTDSDWLKNGHIMSLSTRADEIALLHYHFDPSMTYAIYSKGADISFSEKSSLPASFHARYTDLLLKPDGGVCLFATVGQYPMLYYNSFPKDFSKPDKIINFPPIISRPQFSHNGKYLSFVAKDTKSPYTSCWLVETETWSLVNKIDDRKVLNPSFSSHDRFWLLPGPKPLIIELT